MGCHSCPVFGLLISCSIFKQTPRYDNFLLKDKDPKSDATILNSDS